MTVVVVTAFCFLLSIIYQRTRRIEFIFVAPFLAGSISVLLFSPSYWSIGANIYFSLLIFLQWSLLFWSGFYLKTFSPRGLGSINLTFSPARLNISLIAASAALILYVFGVVMELLSFGNIGEYFLKKRAEAHAGNGWDKTAPYAYKIVNLAASLLPLFASILLQRESTMRTNHATRWLICVFMACVLISSLLEGNRSTIIVPVLATISLYYMLGRPLTRAILVCVFFVTFFVASQIILRTGGQFTLEAVEDAFGWFFLYSFGSLRSFVHYIEANGGIDLYWKSYDVIVQKLGIGLYYKQFFIIESVEVGAFRTNVYSTYAVLDNYGGWLLAVSWVLLSVIIFRVLELISQKILLIRYGLPLIAISFPLGIYHEYLITCLFYFYNFLTAVAFLYVFCGLRVRCVR